MVPNWASTAPVTWVILPAIFSAIAVVLVLERLGAEMISISSLVIAAWRDRL